MFSQLRMRNTRGTPKLEPRYLVIHEYCQPAETFWKFPP
jgi:hypothetical protein